MERIAEEQRNQNQLQKEKDFLNSQKHVCLHSGPEKYLI